MKVTLKKKIDSTLEAIKKIKSLKGLDILVGITEGTASREDDEVNNAQLLAYHTKGVRKKSMKREMEENMSQGLTYEEAHSLYIASHGSPLYHIPPRPVIEPAITAQNNKERIAEDLKIAAKAMLDNKNSTESIKALHVTGLDAVNIIKGWFDDPRNNWPPLSPVTIKAKKSDKPLVDTGKMRDAITYVIKVEEE